MTFVDDPDHEPPGLWNARPMMMQWARHGRLTGSALLFDLTPLKKSETDTSGTASDKTTLGGKAGVSYGIGSGEVSGSREHQGPTGSVANTFQGSVTGMQLAWVQK